MHIQLTNIWFLVDIGRHWYFQVLNQILQTKRALVQEKESITAQICPLVIRIVLVDVCERSWYLEYLSLAS